MRLFYKIKFNVNVLVKCEQQLNSLDTLTVDFPHHPGEEITWR